jgi:hypothetical protein
MSICAESEYSEALVVDIHELPMMTVMSEMEACYGQEFMMSAELSGTAPWTVNIEGYGDMTVESSPMEMSWMAMSDSSMMVNWVQDANMCLNEESVTLSLSVHENPMVVLEDASICMNHEITLDAGNEGATYNWSTGETSQQIVVDSTGMDANNQREISAMVTNEFDCSSEETVLISFEDCSGISELGLSNWSAYPNPSNGMIELELTSDSKQEFELEILNLQGQLIYQETVAVEWGTNHHQLDLTDLAPQTYLLVIKNNGDQLIKRMIIE